MAHHIGSSLDLPEGLKCQIRNLCCVVAKMLKRDAISYLLRDGLKKREVKSSHYNFQTLKAQNVAKFPTPQKQTFPSHCCHQGTGAPY